MMIGTTEIIVVGVVVLVLIASHLMTRSNINYYFKRKREYLDGLGLTKGEHNGA